MNWLRESAIGLGWKDENIRIESFAAPIAKDVENHPFTLHLTKTNKEIEVKADQSILDALQHSGVEPAYACMQGTCGTCITTVVEGEVDHRDAFLSESEKSSNTAMCMCVSRAKGDRLSVEL